MKRHPLSAAFPDMQPDEFASLVADIKANGLREQGWTYEGMILDGWHRSRACEQAGVTFRYGEYKGSDPVGFVKSKNLERRHLTGSQRAAAIVACHAWAESGVNQHTKKGGGEPGSPPPATVAQMAKEAGVSTRTVQHAKTAHAAGLGEPVRDGAMTAKEAATAATGTAEPKAQKRDPKDKKIDALATENAALKDEIEQVREGAAEAVAQAELAAALVETEPAKLLLQKDAEIKRLTRDRDDYMNKCGQLVKQVKSLERRLAQYERKAA